MIMATTTEIRDLEKRMEYLGEETTFTKEEREKLEKVFTLGKLDDCISKPLWLRYTNKQGEVEYCGSFSSETLNCMYQICKERVERKEKELKDLYNNFTLKKVADYLNEKLKFYANSNVNSTEWLRIKEKATKSKAEVECGKCNYEDKVSPYECVVIRERQFYSGLIRIRKNENGYEITKRAPLCGECTFYCDKYELFKVLNNFVWFVCS